jgi:iron complex transport system ATP-binding protein
MALLKATDLSVGWSSQAVAQLPDFSLSQGQVVVLAGPNGAGKSTALKTFARQIKPLGGSITIGGNDCFAMESKQFARHVAYVPQILDPPHELTVYELVSLGRNPHQPWWSWQTSQDDRAAVQDALEKTGTWELRKQLVKTLSGGERQRAFVAMAVAQKPDFMLLDEPTAHLDFKHQLELVSLLNNLKSNGLGMLVVLHDLNLTARLADEVVLLKRDGSAPSVVAASGPPSNVLTHETIKAVYEVDVLILKDPNSDFTTYTPIGAHPQASPG